MLNELLFPLTTPTGRKLGALSMVFCVGIFLYIFIHTIFIWHADLNLSKNSTYQYNFVKTPALSFNEILRWHLFGINLTSTTFVPVTNLQLQLVGIMKAANEQDSRAIISVNGQKAKIYRIKDIIISDVKIISIYTNAILLENGGQIEKLPLNRNPLLFKNKLSDKRLES